MVSDIQITLERPRLHPWRHSRLGVVTKALPFYRSRQGRYVHRVRSGLLHKLGHRDPHASYTMWCGQHGFISRMKDGGMKGELFAVVPAGSVLCATCEGRAVGAGLLGAPIIGGHPVKFSPRF